MPEEVKSVSGEEMLGADTDYVAAIEELQKTTVSKESYEKVRAENKRLLDALVKGEKIEAPVSVSVDELRKKLFGGQELTNLDFVDTTLKLRSALIERGEPDPFLPIGDKVKTTADTYETAHAVAQVLQECVDFAQGDSGIFTAELQRRTKDVPIPIRRK